MGENVTEIITLSGFESFVEKVPVGGKMQDVERECKVEIAIRWVNGFDNTIQSFVNTIPTTQGGTHITGFDRALTRATNDILLKETR